ncbi:MAG: hypothetical protein AB7G93_10250 [Bdellovibrionales bacterium]
MRFIIFIAALCGQWISHAAVNDRVSTTWQETYEWVDRAVGRCLKIRTSGKVLVFPQDHKPFTYDTQARTEVISPHPELEIYDFDYYFIQVNYQSHTHSGPERLFRTTDLQSLNQAFAQLTASGFCDESRNEKKPQDYSHTWEFKDLFVRTQ